jgi:hypothetical protein
MTKKFEELKMIGWRFRASGDSLLFSAHEIISRVRSIASGETEIELIHFTNFSTKSG